MDSTTVTALTTAFDAGDLVDTFILLAPFVIGIAGIVLGVALVKWGIRVVRRKLSGGAA